MFKSYRKSDWVNVGVGVTGICTLVLIVNVKLFGGGSATSEKIVSKETKPSLGASMKVVEKVDQEVLGKSELYENEVKEMKKHRNDNLEFEEENHVGFTEEKQDVESRGKQGIDKELIDQILNDNTNASGFITQDQEEVKVEKISEKREAPVNNKPVKAKSAKKEVAMENEIPQEPIAPAVKRKTGFNTLRKDNESEYTFADKREVMAVVHGDQTLTNGGTIKIRLKDDLEVDQRTVRRNTIVYGVISIVNDRALIDLTSMRVADQIIATDIKIYSLDGMEGIPINDIAGSSETREGVLDEALGDIGQQIGSRTGTRALFRGARDQNRIEKVTVVGNTKLILR